MIKGKPSYVPHVLKMGGIHQVDISQPDTSTNHHIEGANIFTSHELVNAVKAFRTSDRVDWTSYSSPGAAFVRILDAVCPESGVAPSLWKMELDSWTNAGVATCQGPVGPLFNQPCHRRTKLRTPNVLRSSAKGLFLTHPAWLGWH